MKLQVNTFNLQSIVPKNIQITLKLFFINVKNEIYNLHDQFIKLVHH